VNRLTNVPHLSIINKAKIVDEPFGISGRRRQKMPYSKALFIAALTSTLITMGCSGNFAAADHPRRRRAAAFGRPVP
jgi:hypothetical protein